MLLLTLTLAILVGLSVGLLGGGGSILSLPILVYVAGMSPKQAIPMELLIVGATSLAALIPHARAGNVRWRTGVTFGAASMVGAYLGGRGAILFSGPALLILFATLMLVSAAAMLRGRPASSASAHRVSDPPPAEPRGLQRLIPALPPGGLAAAKDRLPRSAKVTLVLMEGFVVGSLTGLVGAGGGFMIVPTLVILGGLPMRAAVGTSVLIIAMKSFAGAAGHLDHADIPVGLTAGFAAIAVVGSVVGANLAARVPQAQLRRGFGAFVLAMGGLMMTKESGLLTMASQQPAIAVGLLLAAALAVVLTGRVIFRREVSPAGAE